MVGAALLTGCAATPVRGIEPPLAAPAPSRIESRYALETARTLYRGRAVEQNRVFVDSPAGPFGICVRAPGAKGYEHMLLVLQRRIVDDYIPQAADDVLVLRGLQDTAPCRRLQTGWVSGR